MRDKKLNSSTKYKKLLKAEIAEIRNEIIKEALIPGSKLSKEPNEQQVKNIREPSLAKDTVFVAKKSVNPAPMISSNSVVDKITQAVRTEVIITQQLFLQQEIAKTMDSSERLVFEKQNLIEVQKYLKTNEGKEAVAEIMTQPELQSFMHKIESSGYQAVHSKFQDSFHDVPWSEKDSGVVRFSNIINDDKQEVCILKETTIKAQPTSLQLADGNTKMVNSYRQIEFPVGLKEGMGPMHLSMALKDENGLNMPEKDAVYFTAHYNDSGKLTEVSSPIPVKFMGNGNDAIGYIERDGKVYTLPITQGKYHEMMQEVAVNNGMNIDLTAAVKQEEQRAVDKVYSPAIQQAKQIKENLSPKVESRDFATEAVSKLKGVSKEQVSENILTAVKAGDEKLVGAMMEALAKPPKGVAPITDVALKAIYFEGRALANKASGAKAAQIERACGKMAESARVRHDVSKTKGSSIAL